MDSSLEAIASEICNSKGLMCVEKIGEGAFKETYLVLTNDGQAQALKVVRAGCSAERTKREVEAMKRCNHPNIARLYDVSSINYDGVEYTFMLEEYIGGGTLDDSVRGCLLTIDEALTIGIQLIDAIQHVASHDLVHRDLKPANIMFRKDRVEPVIMDFGLVRDLAQESVTHTWLMMGPGTPYFAAPEQLNNDKQLIDWRTDQFALGVVISVCVLGMHPYERNGDLPSDVINRVVAREPPSSMFVNNAKGIGLYAVAKMVSPWPVERYRTPELLLDAWRSE